jgi:hypothetical protein
LASPKKRRASLWLSTIEPGWRNAVRGSPATKGMGSTSKNRLSTRMVFSVGSAWPPRITTGSLLSA